MLKRAIVQVGAAARRQARPGFSGVGARRLYHENIVDHYENPRNVGSLDKNDPKVGTVSGGRRHGYMHGD
jgi:hypothetical protein